MLMAMDAQATLDAIYSSLDNVRRL